MLHTFALLLLAAAVLLLGAALWSVRQLLRQLPAGPLGQRWRALAALLSLLLLGCLAQMVYLGDVDAAGWPALVAPALVLGLSGFAWQACRLFSATVGSVRRMSVGDRAQVTDVLTGLRSRHTLDATLQREMQRADRRGIAVSVMLLDIDHFAQVNRAYGHAVGDQVLTEIGRILTASVRESDLLVRYGGEEIAVLAPHTAPGAALAVAERLRREIESGARKALREAQGARQAITVSIGVAGREAGAGHTSDLFALAEAALRRAKRDGRNRVELATAADGANL